MENMLSNEQKRELQTRLKEAVSKEYAKKRRGQGGKEVTYLSSDTLRQVLNEIVPGGWSFEVVERFREEVYIKPNKDKNVYEFGGYCFHIHARLTIDGLGVRDQFGAKLGQGNRDADSNAYKAASSSALVKCAAMFDIGIDIYTEEGDQYKAPQTEQPQQWANQGWAPQETYNNVVQMPQQNYQPQGFIQQDFPQTVYTEQVAYQPQGQFYQDPSMMQQGVQGVPVQPYAEPLNNQYQQTAQVPFEQPAFPQPQAFEQPQAFAQAQVAPPATAEQREALPEVFHNPAQNLMQAQQQPQVHPELPFENVPPKEEVKQGTFDERYMSKEGPALIQEFTQHRQRLNLMDDKDLNIALRDYFKDANATVANVTNETIAGVVEHFRSIQAV